MPTYNQSSFIKRAIKSLFNQIYQEWELIIINYKNNMKYLIIIAYILAGCSTTPTKGSSTKPTNDSINNGKQGLVVIDITKEYPEKTVYAQDVADVEYIPLETNDSTLVSLGSPDLVSEKYIVYHNQNGQVLVFSRQGKRLYSFNRTGGGPEEYGSISDIVLDEEEKELYIENIAVNTKIYVYSIDGTFKRRLVLPAKCFPHCLMNYDKDYLFCFNSYYMDIQGGRNMSAEDIRHRDSPYFFISKHTGKIIPLDYSIPNRMGNQLHQKKDDGTSGVSYAMNIYPLTQNTPDILITEFADDTLYSLKDKKLLPVMIKKASPHKMSSPMLVGIDLFTDRYFFVSADEKIFDGSNPKHISMVHDKQSDSFYQLNLLNNDYSVKHYISTPLKRDISLPHNTGINSLSAEYLLREYKAGILQGELKQIASKLKEDDNPVLMLIKFKE